MPPDPASTSPVPVPTVPSAAPPRVVVVHPPQDPGRSRSTERARALASWARRERADAGNHGVETLGRLGLVFYGVLHLLMAALAAQIVWGTRGVLVDQDAAVALVAGIGPAGAALLAVAVVGLLAFGFWQLRVLDVGPWGFVGVGVVVGGVAAFGCYCFIDAYARRA